MSFSVVSWNVEGLEKIVRDMQLLQWLAGFSILIFQETFARREIPISGYACFHVPASTTSGRPSCGGAIYLKNSVFGSCHVNPTPAAHPIAQAIRIVNPGTATGLIIANIYLQASDPSLPHSTIEDFDSWLTTTRLVPCALESRISLVEFLAESLVE